jgi:NAD-dependent dihydropyrimidine dehydrogenase PreA subunit
VRHGTHRPGPAPDAPQVALTLDGQPVTARQAKPSCNWPTASAWPFPACARQTACGPMATAAVVWWRLPVSAPWPPAAAAAWHAGHGHSGHAAPAPAKPEHGAGAAAGRPARAPATSGPPTTPPSPMANSANGPCSRASRRAPRLGRPARQQPAPDLSHPAMAVNLDACIQCNRCVRACREVQVNDVIGSLAAVRHTQHRVRPGRPHGRPAAAWLR